MEWISFGSVPCHTALTHSFVTLPCYTACRTACCTDSWASGRCWTWLGPSIGSKPSPARPNTSVSVIDKLKCCDDNLSFEPSIGSKPSAARPEYLVAPTLTHEHACAAAYKQKTTKTKRYHVRNIHAIIHAPGRYCTRMPFPKLSMRGQSAHGHAHGHMYRHMCRHVHSCAMALTVGIVCLLIVALTAGTDRCLWLGMLPQDSRPARRCRSCQCVADARTRRRRLARRPRRCPRRQTWQPAAPVGTASSYSGAMTVGTALLHCVLDWLLALIARTGCWH